MTDPDSKDKSKLLPFWETPQYGGGVMQGIGLAFACLFILNEVSADYFVRYSREIGALGFVLIVIGGLRARKMTV